MRMNKGRRQFKVLWKGYPKSDATWEYDGALNCKALIKDFMKKNQDSQSEDDDYEVSHGSF